MQEIQRAFDLLTLANQQVEQTHLSFATPSAMAMLSTDTSLLGFISGHVTIGFPFTSGLFNLLRVVGKSVMGVLSFGHG
jgi:hypothetical protein